MSILVTGGAGFIGSHLVKLLIDKGEEVAILDKLTYAGSLENLSGLLDPSLSLRYAQGYGSGLKFYRGDICNREFVEHIVKESEVDKIIHLAAETHVDRSIEDASAFLKTNILGTHALLESARQSGIKRFLLVSTDEVYGEVLEGEASEEYPVHPRNPYSASKAGQEHLAYSYWSTHGLPVVIVRGCNNYGPGQHTEKFIPTVITHTLEDKPIPLYGDGFQTREWIHVTDFAEAVALVMEKGVPGEAYNIGSGERLSNKDLVGHILDIMDKPRDLIVSVTDRPGHDRRYAIDSSKIKALGWQSKIPFEVGIRDTMSWYEERAMVR
jgi:dTDP-glucose 4,6-dehydratase